MDKELFNYNIGVKLCQEEGERVLDFDRGYTIPEAKFEEVLLTF